MKRKALCASVAAGILVMGAFMASAQGPHAPKHMRMYDPATETTLKGAVEAVTQQPGGNQMMEMMGTHLTVKTEGENREVMLGPSAFIAGKGFSFVKGDAIEVTGSKVTMAGTEYVIAREVVKDGKTLTLRDKNGMPEWAGSGMGRGGAASREKGR